MIATGSMVVSSASTFASFVVKYPVFDSGDQLVNKIVKFVTDNYASWKDQCKKTDTDTKIGHRSNIGELGQRSEDRQRNDMFVCFLF